MSKKIGLTRSVFVVSFASTILALVVLGLLFQAFPTRVETVTTTVTTTFTQTQAISNYCKEYATLAMMEELIEGGVTEYLYYFGNSLLNMALNMLVDLMQEADNSTIQYRAALVAMKEFVEDVNSGRIEGAVKPYFTFRANIEYLRLMCEASKGH